MSSITPEEAQAAADLVNQYNEQLKAQQEKYLQPIRRIIESRDYQIVMSELRNTATQYANDTGLIPHINGLVQIGFTLMAVLGVQPTDFSQEAEANAAKATKKAK